MFLISVTTQQLDEPGETALAGIRALSLKDRIGAETACDKAAINASSWAACCNVAALALSLERHELAHQHARKALEQRPGHFGAGINLALSSWHLGRQRDAARILERILAVMPGHAMAAVNYSRMFYRIGKDADARDVLERALLAGAKEAQLHSDLSSVLCRLGDLAGARTHALAAISALVASKGHVDLSDLPSDGLKTKRTLPSQEDWHRVLIECVQRLEPLGVDYHWAGGLTRMFALQGNLKGSRKDLDIALDMKVPRALLEATFAEGFDRYTKPHQEAAAERGEYGIGLVHRATGIPVDLFMQERTTDCWRGVFGAPDMITIEYPPFEIRSFECPGLPVRLQLPSPLDEYLRVNYGEDWRESTLRVGEASIPREHALHWLRFPSLASKSYPMAFVRGLQSLAKAFARGDDGVARSYCLHLLSHEDAQEVRAALSAIEHRMRAGAP